MSRVYVMSLTVAALGTSNSTHPVTEAPGAMLAESESSGSR